MRGLRGAALLLVMALLMGACGEEEPSSEPGASGQEEIPAGGEDLGLGGVENPKADGFFGSATTCKPMPALEPLNDPAIVVSLDGLTLHLWDRAGSYDRVFPVGVGAIEDGVSLTPTSTELPTGTFYTKTDEPPVDDGPTPEQGRWGWNQRCRMWWTAENGVKTPVFAGLPFIRLAGHPTSAAYALHGPIDNYTEPSGGTLRRGYVSHGCVRMAAEDIAEIWALLQGRRAEVRIQKPVERLEGGEAVDLEPWLLSECASDGECGFSGGVCRENPYTGRGFCTRACTRSCPDRAGHATSFCAPDPDGEAGVGYCTSKADPVRNNGCERHAGFVAAEGVQRPDGSAAATVCVPGEQAGWIGDGCLADDECASGRCVPVSGGPRGVCSEPCERFCPDSDSPAHAATFCVAAPASMPAEGGLCMAQCFNDDACPEGMACQEAPRFNQSNVTRKVCLPVE